MKTIECQFRAVERGRSFCTVAQLRTDRNTDTIDQTVCATCPVPEIVKKHPCVNLSIGTQIMMQQNKPVLVSYAVDCTWKPFNAITDVDNCDGRCPKWTPELMQIDATTVEPIFNSNDSNVTDSLLRQAVLVVLYRYHCGHPERYGLFDVTPEYMAKALGVETATLARVVLPMAESGEIKLKFKPGHTMFCGATITFKGVERLDREPVLGQLNTATARSIQETNGHARPAGQQPGLFKNATYGRPEPHSSD
ncbi:MAG TPA: hypothetical protein VFC63_17350 [Blastocatellia bacterium]|nr:hypothetical protein [Blastocatellia bacterium]